MTVQPRVPVLVAGAGAVGLALACELRRHGVPCRVVDKREGTTPWSKALVVHARTMEVFERMGVLQEALARGRRTRGAVMRAFGREILHIDLGRLDAPYNFFLDINQSDTEAILEAHLRSLGGEVEWETELSGIAPGEAGVAVRLRRPDGTEEAACDYLCACDGAHSFVRHALGLPFPGAPYEAQFFLADVMLDWDRSPEHWYADIQAQGLFFAAPLKQEGRWRVITELPRGLKEPPATLARGESPTAEDLEFILARMAPTGLRAHDPAWLSWFKVSHRILDRFRHGRVFFAGDAAHIHAPVGGQGMNIGIHDAFNLGWKLALVLDGAAPEALLDSYDAERRPAAADVVDVTDTIIAAVLSKGPLGRTASQAAARLADRLPFVKDRLERILSEVATSYRGSSPIVGEPAEDERGERGGYLTALRRWRGLAFGPRPGDRAPDARLRRADETVVRLFELTRGTGFHLLYFPAAGKEGPSGADLRRQVRDRFGDGHVSLIEIAAEAGGEGEPHHMRLRDDGHATRRAYGIADGGLVLIRPDGHIGFRSQPAAPAALLEHLTLVLRPSPGTAPPPALPPGKAKPLRAAVALGGAAALAGTIALVRARQLSDSLAGPTAKPALAVAALFGLAGAAKLLGARPPRADFRRWGFPPGALQGVGLWELAGAAALSRVATRARGGAALAALMTGAVGTHLRAKEYPRALPALGLLGVNLWIAARRDRGRAPGLPRLVRIGDRRAGGARPHGGLGRW